MRKTMKTSKVLVIEDDEEISRLTKMYLEADGYVVLVVNDGAQALSTIQKTMPDIIILDLMLPNVSGHEICKLARRFYSQPILVLTALDDDINEVSLLKLGADDYLCKPVKPHILEARIEALLRRSTRQLKQTSSSLAFHLDAARQCASIAGKTIDLTDAEFELLNLLYQHKGKTVSRGDCCHVLRGIHYDVSDRSIDMRISGLRKKLNDTQKPYKTIVTVRNKGYLLNVD